MGAWLKRWAPLLGGVVLAGSAILKAVGQGELADSILSLGALFGFNSASPVSAGEFAAAVAVIFGIVRKFLALYRPQA